MRDFCRPRMVLLHRGYQLFSDGHEQEGVISSCMFRRCFSDFVGPCLPVLLTVGWLAAIRRSNLRDGAIDVGMTSRLLIDLCMCADLRFPFDERSLVNRPAIREERKPHNNLYSNEEPVVLFGALDAYWTGF